MAAFITLSCFQVQPLLGARASGERLALLSPDLGLSVVDVRIDGEGVFLPNGARIPWDVIEMIGRAEVNCFRLEGADVRKIQLFSDLTDRVYSLMPTSAAPTMLISGIPMHRIKGTDPYRDTLAKIKAIRPVVGTVLDTATGLGYTAIEAARTADRVITVELDPAALEIAAQNPWSQPLFRDPKIEQRIGDCYDVITEFDDKAFACVIHDPPMFSLAGHLYSGAFYVELCRVLRRGGRLFHYIGDPESRSGRTTTRGVMQRLLDAGFRRVVRKPDAFGVVAFK